MSTNWNDFYNQTNYFMEYPHERTIRFFKRYANKFGTNKNVLEIGFGSGADAKFIASLGFNVVATEVSEVIYNKVQEDIKNKIDNLKLILMNIQDNNFKLPFEDNSIDIITESSVLYAIPKDMYINYMNEFNRVLKKDGMIFTMLLSEEFKDNIKNINNSKDYFNMDYNNFTCQYNRISINELKNIINDNFIISELTKTSIQSYFLEDEYRESSNSYWDVVLKKK